MLLRVQTFTLALLTALLIILGGFGIFIAEAASFQGIIIEAQTYDPGAPYDAFEFGPEDTGAASAPGLPY
jgi:hypothetical protein